MELKYFQRNKPVTFPAKMLACPSPISLIVELLSLLGDWFYWELAPFDSNKSISLKLSLKLFI
jgi:hypothetical protein